MSEMNILNAPASSSELHDQPGPELGRTHPSFRYPVLKNPTGRVQYAIDRSESITVDPLGTIRRGEVISVHRTGKPPNAKALDFCRGLVASKHFAHCAADTPLGVAAHAPETIIEFVDPVPFAPGPAGVMPGETLTSTAPTLDVDAANREHLSTFNGFPESVKKSPK